MFTFKTLHTHTHTTQNPHSGWLEKQKAFPAVLHLVTYSKNAIISEGPR